ncbi:hypothetical protein [uncultured Roseivirga sp.]|uniref:hypothetical protein n=1 Tax=uncultured Roseivirga sp. TaxID=543088 RepID=UPI0030D73E74
MRHLTLTFYFLSTFGLANGQTIELELKPIKKDYYAWITSLNEVPVNWLDNPEGEVKGRAYRTCITTSEIYNNLYIEEVTYGKEGCCKQIESKKEIDLLELFIKFGLTGEEANVESHKWVSMTNFELKIREQIFSITIQQNIATIKRTN